MEMGEVSQMKHCFLFLRNKERKSIMYNLNIINVHNCTFNWHNIRFKRKKIELVIRRNIFSKIGNYI